MIIYNTYTDIPNALQNAVVALGNFDGVHRGHQTVIGEAKKKADRIGAPLVLLTFSTHPRLHFLPDSEPFIITPLDGKIPLLKALGVDGIIALDFQAVKDMPAHDFIQTILIRNLKAQCVSIGYDFQFGKDRMGTSGMLKQQTAFESIVSLPQKSVDGDIFSSTRIRACIRNGEMGKATSLLGRPFEITGIIEAGQQLGRTIDFPTANIDLGDFVRPHYGVYAVRVGVELQNKTQWFDGVANFGTRPTIDNPKEVFETHIFNFNEDIYDHPIRIAMISFIRPEKKFESFDALKAQIADDCLTAKRIHALRQAGA